MFKIRIWYDDNIVNEDVPYYVVIICINCGKTIGCELDNQPIKYSIPNFVTNIVFQNIGLFWVIQSNQKSNFDLEEHCFSWIINGPWYNTTIFNNYR